MKTKRLTKTYYIGGAICACSLLLAGTEASAQNMFVGSYGNNNVVYFPSGSSTPNTFASVNFPNDMAFDQEGDLFVADQFNNTIDEFVNNGGTLSTTATAFATVTDVKALAFDQSGNLYAASDITGDIYKFTGGSESTFATGLNVPQDMAFNSLGILFVGCVGNETAGSGSIVEITPGDSQSPFVSGLNIPSALAFNAIGDLFVSEDSFTTTGSVIEYTSGGIQNGSITGLNQPDGLAFDSSGDLFIADGGLNSENGDITEIAANGTRSVFNTSVSKPLSIAFQGESLPVPEPSVYALLGIGSGVFLFRRRK